MCVTAVVRGAEVGSTNHHILGQTDQTVQQEVLLGLGWGAWDNPLLLGPLEVSLWVCLGGAGKDREC